MESVKFYVEIKITTNISKTYMLRIFVTQELLKIVKKLETFFTTLRIFLYQCRVKMYS